MNTKPIRSFTFIDSVSRFGRQLSKEELETAYGRAGRSFNGQLQQNFVVLNERDQDLLQPSQQRRPAVNRADPAQASGSSGSGTANAKKGVKRSGNGIENSKSKK
jgi:hypothetical protein